MRISHNVYLPLCLTHLTRVDNKNLFFLCKFNKIRVNLSLARVQPNFLGRHSRSNELDRREHYFVKARYSLEIVQVYYIGISKCSRVFMGVEASRREHLSADRTKSRKNESKMGFWQSV